MDVDELDAIQRRTFARATAPTLSSYSLLTRLAGERLSGYIDSRAFAVVISPGPDGRPHSAITSFFRRGSTFWLPAVAGSVRAKNVGTNPWLVLVITEGDRDKHIAVIIEGPGAAVSAVDTPTEVAASARWAPVWLRLDAQRILSYSSDES